MKKSKCPTWDTALDVELLQLRIMMKRKKVTAKMAAEMLNTSYSNITKVLTGVRKSQSLIFRLVEVLKNI